MPFLFMLVLAGGAFGLSVFGLRGLLGIREALRLAEFDRLSKPALWPVTRAFAGMCAGLPVLSLVWPLGGVMWPAALATAALGYWVAPQFLASAQQRAERELLDDLPLHLDLIAIAMESGSSLAAAIAVCGDRAPECALRRAWLRVLLDIHGGTEPLDALRGLEQRVGLRSFSTLLTELRTAQRLGFDTAHVFRERSRQAAANRFARAERLARAAPLKLWATLMLCIAPCTLLVLAFPVARLMALAAGR